ncbi:MAG: flagellar brake domain-containing protein [Desulfamplus sp.]|nr:flagellar brake domain-containing protein [Desulfamplus sp.]
MKTLFKPISSMFGRKNEADTTQEQVSSASAEQSNSMVQMDDHGLAKRYCDTFSAVQTVQTKLDKLLETKELIAEERFASLHEQYTSFLDKHKPSLKKLSDEINRRIDSCIADKKDAADKFTEIKKRIQQEAKLLEVGAISKEEYIEKIQNFKPEEKECKEKYKTSQDRITILKDAKNNKYTPPPEPSSDAAKNDGAKDDVADKDRTESNKKDVQDSRSQIYSGKEVDINFSCGTNLSVKIDGIAIPIIANFVGTEKYEYLLITNPSPYSTIKPKLFQGNKLVIECIFEGQLFVFSSPIIENIAKPIRAVVLEYPKEVSVKRLRSSSRVTCRIPASLIFKGSGKESIISDINHKGCLIEVTYQMSEKNYIARADDNIKIECSFPGNAEVHTISGIIRNVKKKQLTLLYGIQFTEVSESAQKAIVKYLSTL